MISFSLVKSALLEVGKRTLKVIHYGPKTAKQIAPFGDDSSPLKDMIAIHGKTDENGENIVLGYINKNQIAKPGEKRIFSTDANGNFAVDIYLRNSGDIELGGNHDNLVQFTALKNGLSQQDSKINAELEKIRIAITALGGSYPKTDVSTNIDDARLNNLKCP